MKPTPPPEVQSTLDNPDAANDRYSLYHAAMWANHLGKFKLADYCARKGDAVLARLEGRIADALKYEARCQGIYNAIPAGDKW